MLTKNKYKNNCDIATKLYLETFGGTYVEQIGRTFVNVDDKEIRVSASMDKIGFMVTATDTKPGIAPDYLYLIDEYAILREYPDGRVFWFIIKNPDEIIEYIEQKKNRRIPWKELIFFPSCKTRRVK
ncbi:MAG: hypothetical protein DRQ62_06175 [Gammaproteobacteria bacterium]|nr:MAG: hypothetical protein DRQ62_06175 [Gammaproteobacteria bacterium]